MSQGIILLGLGPGDPELLTVQAKNLLTSTPEVYFRTDHHPVAKAFAATTKIHSFDSLYESSEHFEDVYSQIIEEILRLGRMDNGVLYAVPGHPFVAEATCPEIYRRARAEGIPVRVVEGISFIEPVCSALGLDPFPPPGALRCPGGWTTPPSRFSSGYAGIVYSNLFPPGRS